MPSMSDMPDESSNADGAAYGAESKPKSKRVQEKDIQQVEQWVKTELHRRKGSEFRKKAETKWREVDRQVSMEAMQRFDRSGRQMPADWRQVLEIGKMSEALEIISADVRRLAFPTDQWFEAHCKINAGRNEDGTIKQPDAKMQTTADNALRAFMVQQQRDTGMKDRHELSVKEALLHGSFVAEVCYEPRLKVDEGYKIKSESLPVWRPHSMWNCYPDPSPHVVVSDLFYQGSMLILSYIPRYKLEQMTGEGWMQKRYKLVASSFDADEDDKAPEEMDEVQILSYFGDMNIERPSGDLYFPNSKACFANGTMVYFSPSELSYLPLIYRGYEKQDVRDPYFVSPLMKMSPMQKTASVMLNRFLDGVELKLDPPGVYDGNDSAFVSSGGPRIEPGSMMATKGSGKVQHFETGDPLAALNGFKEAIQMIEVGIGVNSVRSGGTTSSGRTAFEIDQVAKSANIRTLDFIDKLEQGLEAFLYMQHDLNKKYVQRYDFYNSDLDTPDYLTVEKKDLPQFVKFTVTGSKNVLNEDNRVAKTSQVTAFLLGNPATAEKVNLDEIAKQMYMDAGNSNPERLLNVTNGVDPKIKKIMDAVKQKSDEVQQLAQQEIQAAQDEQTKLQQQVQELQGQLTALQADKSIEQEKLQLESQKVQGELGLKQAQFAADQSQTDSQAQGENLDRQMFVEAMQPIVASLTQAAQMMMEAADKASAPRQIKLIDDNAGRLVGAVSVVVPVNDTIQ